MIGEEYGMHQWESNVEECGTKDVSYVCISSLQQILCNADMPNYCRKYTWCITFEILLCFYAYNSSLWNSVNIVKQKEKICSALPE